MFSSVLLQGKSKNVLYLCGRNIVGPFNMKVNLSFKGLKTCVYMSDLVCNYVNSTHGVLNLLFLANMARPELRYHR